MRREIRRAGQIAVCLVLLWVFAACSSENPPPLAVNIKADHSEELEPGERIILSAELSSAAVQGPISYRWSATSGLLPKNDTPSVEFTAPHQAGEVAIDLIVTVGETEIPVSKTYRVKPPPTLTKTPTETPTEPPATAPTATPTETVAAFQTETPTAAPTEEGLESPTEAPTDEVSEATEEAPVAPAAPACTCDTSEACLVQMWEAYDRRDYEKALACIDEVELKWGAKAGEQQTKKADWNCEYTPNPDNEEENDQFWADYWALNDVGVALLMRGKMLAEQGRCAAAEEAFRTVINTYGCAYGWNPQGFYWSAAEGARVELARGCP